METEMLVKIGIVAAFIIMLLFIFNNARISRARSYVLKKRLTIKNQMENARLLAREWAMMGIAEPAFFVELKQEFEYIERLSRFIYADWVTERKNIDLFGERLAKAILALTEKK